MQNLQNQKDAHLMIWETNTTKRQKGNHQTNINLPKDKILNVGDKIFSGLIGQTSYWTIVEIKNKRDSSISNMDYYETIAFHTNLK